ncbi:MAG TPA: site-specific DNA-methyltransferase [Candidatus Deferrimicrobium sp.]|nr:site-specific DNA-methyltransferase [Candidatus Deferrimicrobium sp.]
MSEKTKERKRKNRYIAGLAALNFKVQNDWEIEDASALYTNAAFEIEVDKIFFEDCIEGMKKLPSNLVDLVIADPPFGIEFNGKGSQYNRDNNLVIEGYQEISQDYEQFTMEWVMKLPRIMKETASAFIFSGWTNLKDVLIAIEKANLTLINHIIWKYQFGVFSRKKFVTSHYHILFVVKDPKKYFFNKIEHYPLDIWDIPRTYRPNQQKNSTKLPEKVVMRCIDFCSKPGDLVFDPFMGNATTAVSAKVKFRHYLGFEINENMREIIIKNVKEVKVGASYVPYKTSLPDEEELIKKYPHLRKIKSNITETRTTQQTKLNT